MRRMISSPMSARVTPMPVAIKARLLSKEDVPHLVLLEEALPPGDRWPVRTFLKAFARKDRLGMVLHEGTCSFPTGYFIIAVRPLDLVILRCHLPPSPEYEILRAIFHEWAYNQAQGSGKISLTTWVRESDTSSQLKLQKLDFRCVSIIKGFYQSPPEDCYLFKRKVLPRDGAK